MYDYSVNLEIKVGEEIFNLLQEMYAFRELDSKVDILRESDKLYKLVTKLSSRFSLDNTTAISYALAIYIYSYLSCSRVFPKVIYIYSYVFKLALSKIEQRYIARGERSLNLAHSKAITLGEDAFRSLLDIISFIVELLCEI
ncbi:hypothetical protein GCG54_00003845 [Colletotrichum gloeosporioides]|uniref:Uncharacterized protein n=1 Tax=Colletotrichum gloeosporioides TaxID=474922 RepID=A0A8H4CEG3_COLGL|nr:uncharacterized protein GCG54_00003845 [Colletotrichum gloeosporioides]KAF3802379.1 hypothetical protein GCG54_00003845 [Colletotrichum gloeosporioides]